MRAERALAVLAIVLALASFAAKAQRRPQVGGDLALICGSAQALAQGAIPYDRATLNRFTHVPTIPITYPPLAVLALSPACGAVPYLAIWPVFGIVAFVILRRVVPLAPLTLASIVAAGFAALEWTMLTGNPSIVELPLMAVAMWGLAQSRPGLFGAVVGILTFLKMAPLAYLAAAADRFNFRRVMAATGVAVLVAAALHGLSAVVAPSVFKPYWQAVFSGFGGFIAAERQDGGEGHPALISLATDLALWLHAGPVYVVVFLGLAAIAGVWVLIHLWGRRFDGAGMDAAAVVLLLAAIFTPRLKPYAFAALVPAIAILLSRFDLKRRLAGMAATCVAPTLALAATALLTPPGALQPALGYKIVFGYMPLYSAAVMVMLSVAPGRRSH